MRVEVRDSRAPAPRGTPALCIAAGQQPQRRLDAEADAVAEQRLVVPRALDGEQAHEDRQRVAEAGAIGLGRAGVRQRQPSSHRQQQRVRPQAADEKPARARVPSERASTPRPPATLAATPTTTARERCASTVHSAEHVARRAAREQRVGERREHQRRARDPPSCRRAAGRRPRRARRPRARRAGVRAQHRVAAGAASPSSSRRSTPSRARRARRPSSRPPAAAECDAKIAPPTTAAEPHSG